MSKLIFASSILSAVLFFFGTGLHPHWWMTWFAAVPVLAFAYKASVRATFAAAFTAYLLGNLNLWIYFKILEIPIPVRILAFVSTSLVFAAGVLLSRIFLVRDRRISAMLALPVVWTAFEFALSFGRNGTALNIAYSQMDCLPLLQLASVTGIWGIGFFLFMMSSAMAQTIDSQRVSRETLVALAVVFIVFGFGFWRLQSSPAGSSIKIGLAASDQRPLLGDESKASALTSTYRQAVSQLSRDGATIIVLPEKIMTVSDYHSGEFFREMRQAASTNSVLVVAGVNQKGEPLKHNLAFALWPTGEALYEKHHMVVGWEDGYEIGKATTMLPAPYQNIGVAICKDMDFPQLSRTYGRLGAQLMLVPAWDFEIDDWLHGRMAIMRSVESGFAMARSAKQGFMTINDSRGRVLAELRSNNSGEARLLGTVTLAPERTIYARFGDWFAWLDLAALIAVLASLSRSRASSVTDNSR